MRVIRLTQGSYDLKKVPGLRLPRHLRWHCTVDPPAARSLASGESEAGVIGVQKGPEGPASMGFKGTRWMSGSVARLERWHGQSIKVCGTWRVQGEPANVKKVGAAWTTTLPLHFVPTSERGGRVDQVQCAVMSRVPCHLTGAPAAMEEGLSSHVMMKKSGSATHGVL